MGHASPGADSPVVSRGPQIPMRARSRSPTTGRAPAPGAASGLSREVPPVMIPPSPILDTGENILQPRRRAISFDPLPRSVEPDRGGTASRVAAAASPKARPRSILRPGPGKGKSGKGRSRSASRESVDQSAGQPGRVRRGQGPSRSASRAGTGSRTTPAPWRSETGARQRPPRRR